MKLKESIPANSVKIIELYNKIISDTLILRPSFQRKLVWKKQHKYHFIETILMNFPFPEIYIASSQIDIENLTAQEIVVDGQQRLSTIIDYIRGVNDFEQQNRVTSFDKLTVEEKKDFLNYLVTVRDLKNMEYEAITEVFERINSTEYCLNQVEKNNAIYGDGEFAVFCKQIIDEEYNPTDKETEVVIDPDIKTKYNNFFCKNYIFSKNDIARMYDLQYIMLICATILEGGYFGRSSKIKDYMEQYNETFEKAEYLTSRLLQSINLISSIKLEKGSYWFNQANLFTLIIEFSKLPEEKILDLNIRLLEVELLELENKVDNYFMANNEDDLKYITTEEQKYFEVARQGSHEKSAREYRAMVLTQIINKCLENKSQESVEINPTLFDSLFDYAILIPTENGLNKSIMDATSSVREFLKKNNIHNYDTQEKGPAKKIILKAAYLTEQKNEETEISMYKANHRGDARIWIKNLKTYASPLDSIALLFYKNSVYIINTSRYKIENAIKYINR